MRNTNANQWMRAGLWAAAGVGLVAGPAFAFGAMGFGGFHGGGGFHGAAFHGSPRPTFINRPPGVHFHDGHHHDHFHAHFHNRFHNGWGLGWGWGGWGGDGGYQVADAQPVYAPPEPPRVAEPPPCAELLTWSPKLGRATRQRLCDAG